MKKLILVFCLLVGLAAGVGAGITFGPSGRDKMAEQKESLTGENPEVVSLKKKEKTPGEKGSDYEYLKLTKQFVVPVVDADRISALVTMSLSLETIPGITETFYAVEPKLRDGFLQVMFDHANTGGFDGSFTDSGNMSVLRKALLETARKDLGDDVTQVLIMSVSRQDV